MSDERIATDFGDKQPEDVWDDGDPWLVRLAVIEGAIEPIRDDTVQRAGRVRGALRLLDSLDDRSRDALMNKVRLTRARRALEAMR